MTLARVAWHSGRKLGKDLLDPVEFEGYDIHVLPGKPSRHLKEILLLVDDKLGAFMANALPQELNNVNIEFSPKIALTSDTPPDVTGHGVEVNLVTGAVTVTTPLPTPHLRTFIIEAIISFPDPTNSSNTKELAPLPIRMHVHTSVVDMWLTPSTLTIPEGANGQRFTLLARFDDDTIGDITRMPGITWTPTLSNNTDIGVDSAGRITVKKDSGQQQITATLPPGWGGHSASATVRAITGWGNKPSTVRAATLLSGPETDNLDEVCNVLFIPEGFTDAERDDFDALVQELVEELRRDKVTRPFDLFAQNDAINYWSVFVPSTERGISPLNEARLIGAGNGKLQGDPLPMSLRPFGTDPWTVEQMLFQVGLPLPADGPEWEDATTPGQEQEVVENKIKTWQTLFGNTAIPDGRINRDNFSEWIDYRHRWLINERDTALGLALGGRPNITRQKRARSLTWNVVRTRRSHLDEFLDTLTDFPGGKIIGSNWTFKPLFNLAQSFASGLNTRQISTSLRGKFKNTGHEFASPQPSVIIEEIGSKWTIDDRGKQYFIRENPDQTLTVYMHGKDRPFVVALAGGSRSGGAYSPGELVAAGLVRSSKVEVTEVTGTKQLNITPYPIPRGFWGNPYIGPMARGTVAHEMAHAFGLEDEYGEEKSPLPVDRIKFTLQDGNIQPELELETSPGSKKLDGDKIRWRWPRIKKAAVLIDPPIFISETDGQKEYIISLRFGHKNVFEDGDIVFLRQRPLLKLPADPKQPQLNLAKASDALQIVGEQMLEQVLVRDISGTLDPSKFTAISPFESILFMPVPPPGDAAGEPYAELIAPVIRQHIKTSKAPLNRPRTQGCFQDDSTTQQVLNLPSLSFSWSPSYRIVGAFDGGNTYYCGIYHPTGECIMRGKEHGSYLKAEFCPVCRYLLVDRVAPQLHGVIDQEYADIYPEPKTP
jgi:hypothetical protein